MAKRLQSPINSIRDRLSDEQLETSAKLQILVPVKLLDKLGAGGRTWITQLAAGSLLTGNFAEP